MSLDTMDDFTFKHTEQADNISGVYTAAQIKTYYDSRGVELRTFINALVGILNSVTDGSSGADNVSATAISGLSGGTVQALLEALKTALDNTVLGQIPDNTLTTAKYQNGSVTAAKCAADVATQAELDAVADALQGNINTEASSRSSADTTLQGNIDNLAGAGRTTETVKGNADALGTHLDEEATDGVHGLDATIAKFKASNSTFTDNDTAQTFTDDFCTASSLVTVCITSVTKPQGTWTVISDDGSFAITSTETESADITFDYFITKVV